jgi:hypothetical protein
VFCKVVLLSVCKQQVAQFSQGEGLMKTVDTHGSFEEALSGSSREVTEIAEQLRDLIIDVYPDVVEVPWPKQRIIGYGVGPKKMSEHFCYIAAQRDYVNLGFYYGVELPDPDGLLEGTGKNLRHVKVRNIEQVAQAALRALLHSSLEERKKALNIEN